MKFINHSSEESREKRIYSKLAIVESIIFAFVPWILYIFFDFEYSLIIPILVAPLLLLRTEESTQLSHNMFLHKIKMEHIHFNKSFWFFLIIFTTFLIAFFILIFILDFIPDGLGLLIYLFLGILIINMITPIFNSLLGLNFLGDDIYIASFLGVFAGINFYGYHNEISDSVVAFVWIIIGSFVGVFIGKTFGGVGIALGLFLRSLIIKLLATINSLVGQPLITFLQIPDNFKEQLLINDFYYSPELLPKISKKEEIYSLFFLLKKEKRPYKYLVAPFWSLAYLYRWSVKSTSWFYFPLFLLTNTKDLKDKTKIKTKLDDQTSKIVFIGHATLLIPLSLYFLGLGYNETIISSIPQAEIFYKLIQDLITNFPLILTLFHPIAPNLLLIGTLLYFFIWAFSEKQILEEKKVILKILLY